MNKALDMATGDYCFFLNAGDYLLTESILQECFFDVVKNKNYSLIYGDTILSHDNKNLKIQKAKVFNKTNLFRFGTRVVCHQSMFVSIKIVDKYDLSFRLKGELDWYFSICDQIKDSSDIFYTDSPIVSYSLGGEGDVNFMENFFERFKVVKKRFGNLGVIQFIPWAIITIVGRLKGRLTMKLNRKSCTYHQ